MSISRIVRIHFVYQFIISLSLILFAISFIEILLDKRFLFLTLIPVFAYQLLIIFVCTELLPLPSWLAWIETENEPLSDQEKLADDPDLLRACPSEGSKSPKENTIDPASSIAGLHPKNKDHDPNLCDANTQTVYQHVSDIFKKAPKAHRSESAKNNPLKFDKRRFDYNFKTKDARACRTRNYRSVEDEMSADLDFEMPLEMPAWDAIDYFGQLNYKTKRKSISTEALDRELMMLNSHFEQNEKNDFTRSMEVTKETIEPIISKKGIKSSASFNKWKQGVSNYFNRTKLGSFGADNKQEEDNKQKLNEDRSLSKDVVNQEKRAVLKARSFPCPKYQFSLKENLI